MNVHQRRVVRWLVAPRARRATLVLSSVIICSMSIYIDISIYRCVNRRNRSGIDALQRSICKLQCGINATDSKFWSTYCMGVLPRYKNKYMIITSMRRKPCIEKNRCLLHSETTTRLNATPAGATRGGRYGYGRTGRSVAVKKETRTSKNSSTQSSQLRTHAENTERSICTL